MSYTGKPDLRLEAQRLREQGLSIKEIRKRLNVSLSSISLWVRDVKLTEKQLESLYLNKKTGNLKGSIIAARNKIKAREEITKKLLKEGMNEVGTLSERDRFIAGVALYFAEGTKGDKNVSFSNSDALAITFMIGWLRQFCAVPEDKFRVNLYIHNNLDEIAAKKFWSKLINVPLDQFGKSYIVKNNKNRFRKAKHIYGVLRLTVSNVNLHRKIMGQISGLFQ
ncbi:MAG: helix-turn-helix domain-containing protein [Minisyncoccales bacterium]